MRQACREQRLSLILIVAVIASLHVVGFGLLFGVVAPRHIALAGLLAYVLGIRHAFDVDHIAAVDNTVRKLMGQSDRRPLSVGFWFSLGHSTVVFALTIAITFGVRAVGGQVANGSSTLHTVASVLGPAISGAFLWFLAISNGLALKNNHGHSHGGAWLDRVTKSMSKPWHIYPVGVLFGFGFDTATEIGLLVLAGGVAVHALPLYAILVLPVLFVSGMCLMDTAVGFFMNGAYGWSLGNPHRNGIYNQAVTGISIFVAAVVGTAQILSIFGVHIPLGVAGYALTAFFVVVVLVAASVTRPSKSVEPANSIGDLEPQFWSSQSET